MHVPQRITLAMLLIVIASATRADDGHDHGEAPAAAAPALPRFTAVDATYELVGVLDGTHLRLYLDHAVDNSPVPDAELYLEIGEVKLQSLERPDVGEYEATLAEELEQGETQVRAMVVVGQRSSALTGDLHIHHDDDPEHAHGAHWLAYLGAGFGALAVLALLVRSLRRARHAKRHPGAAV
jgi:hypothetical protein